MNMNTKRGLYIILPLVAAALLAGQAGDAAALKASGTSVNSYGSATASVVCGDRLCSEYPGGRAAFEAAMRGGTSQAEPPATDPSMADDKMKDDSMEDAMMEDAMMEDTMMEDTMMEDTMMDDSMEDAMMEDTMMEKKAMKDRDAMKEKYGTKKLTLARASVPATIPMHMGYYEDGEVYYIITDSSDETHASVVTQMQGWKVELAPLLAQAPQSALTPVYFFTNGVEGDGVHGYQAQVFASVPGQDGYSALTSHIHVTWSDESDATVLTSEADIMKAADDGMLVMTELPVVMNMPHIVWPGGQMTVVERELTNDSPYGEGQVLDIDTEAMEVTFIAHRGWGPDGRTIYYIVTDATPSGPAEAMGVVSTPSSASLMTTAAAVDLYQFRNGIKGPGPLGFQPGIATGALGDANYSPMWRIFVVGWDDPSEAALLETIDDINAYREAGLVSVGLARPMDSDHIVNCPFIDPFQ